MRLSPQTRAALHGSRLSPPRMFWRTSDKCVQTTANGTKCAILHYRLRARSHSSSSFRHISFAKALPQPFCHVRREELISEERALQTVSYDWCWWGDICATRLARAVSQSVSDSVGRMWQESWKPCRRRVLLRDCSQLADRRNISQCWRPDGRRKPSKKKRLHLRAKKAVHTYTHTCYLSLGQCDAQKPESVLRLPRAAVCSAADSRYTRLASSSKKC